MNNIGDLILNDKQDHAMYSFTLLFIEDRNHVKSSIFFLLDFIRKEADAVPFDPPVIPE